MDLLLRSLKYLLLGLFLYAVLSMSVDSIRSFLNGPYGVIADVKMLNFFRFIGAAGRRLSPAWFAAGIAGIFLLLVLSARVSGHWHTDLPDAVYYELVPAAEQFSHP